MSLPISTVLLQTDTEQQPSEKQIGITQVKGSDLRAMIMGLTMDWPVESSNKPAHIHFSQRHKAYLQINLSPPGMELMKGWTRDGWHTCIKTAQLCCSCDQNKTKNECITLDKKNYTDVELFSHRET